MTKEEMRECIDMAKRFAELYHTTGLVSVSTRGLDRKPSVHLTLSAFKELYTDGELHFRPHCKDDYEVYAEDDGVTVFSLLDKKSLMGEEDE